MLSCSVNIAHDRVVQHLQYTSRFKNNFFAELPSGSEEGSYVRRPDFLSLNSRLQSNKEERKTPEIKFKLQGCWSRAWFGVKGSGVKLRGLGLRV